MAKRIPYPPRRNQPPNALPSSVYWAVREKQHIEEMEARTKDYGKDIARIYRKELTEIEREIAYFYQRYGDKNHLSFADAKKAVDAFDVQAAMDKAREWVWTRDFGKEANAQLELYNAAMKINRLKLLESRIGLYLVDLGDQTQKYMTHVLEGEAVAEAVRQAGILGPDALLVDPATLDAIVRGSYKTDMTKRGLRATFSERLWGHNSKLMSALDNLLTQGLIQGKHPRDLARDLRKMFDVSRYEAERLTRTETCRAATGVQLASFDENDIDYYIVQTQARPCGICQPFDQRVLRVKDVQIGTNAPPWHPNCMCSLSAWFDENGHSDWLYDEAAETRKIKGAERAAWYDDWFRRHQDDYPPSSYRQWRGAWEKRNGVKTTS